MSKKVEKIFIHCSDSYWGSALEIDKWHKARGWSSIGYLGVITNGFPFPGMTKPWIFADGSWEWGRPLDDDTILEDNEIEAQVYGWNNRSIGICLIGKPEGIKKRCKFTKAQLLKAKEVVEVLLNRFSLPVEAVLGHYEVEPAKICPGMDMNLFRKFLKNEISLETLMKDLI